MNKFHFGFVLGATFVSLSALAATQTLTSANSQKLVDGLNKYLGVSPHPYKNGNGRILLTDFSCKEESCQFQDQLAPYKKARVRSGSEVTDFLALLRELGVHSGPSTVFKNLNCTMPDSKNYACEFVE
ncbi:hypothetical protein K2X30_09405 [bacterium]|jgi:hypothetical protein|nr:hypothetical protein [bacterium]